MRVYSPHPNQNLETPERSVSGIRCFTPTGELKNVRRVVFEHDVSEGLATVTTLISDGACFLTDPKTRRAIEVSFRTMVTVIESKDVATDSRVKRADEISERTFAVAKELACITWLPDAPDRQSDITRGSELTQELKQLRHERVALFTRPGVQSEAEPQMQEGEIQARILRIAAELAFCTWQPETLGDSGKMIVELKRLFGEMDRHIATSAMNDA